MCGMRRMSHDRADRGASLLKRPIPLLGRAVCCKGWSGLSGADRCAECVEHFSALRDGVVPLTALKVDLRRLVTLHRWTKPRRDWFALERELDNREGCVLCAGKQRCPIGGCD